MSDGQGAKPTVVLVHGAWGDGSGWSRVIPLLTERGIRVYAVQNPTTSLAADVAATNHILDVADGPVVLVGHSWGGTVITEAGHHPKVAALVYVAAFAPDIGQSTGDQVAAYPTPPGLSEISLDSQGGYWMSLNGWINCVAQDLPEAEARLLHALQPPLGATTFSDKVTSAAWAERPNWYVVSSEDKAVSVELQHALSKTLMARTTELASSHMSILSHPQAVADVILDAVAEVISTANGTGDDLSGATT